MCSLHLPRLAGEVHVVAEMQSELTHMLLLRARALGVVEAMSSADEDPPRAELLQAAIDAVAVLQPGSPTYCCATARCATTCPRTAPRAPTTSTCCSARRRSSGRAARSDGASQLPPGTPSEPAQRPPPPAHACFAAVRVLVLSVPLPRPTRALRTRAAAAPAEAR